MPVFIQKPRLSPEEAREVLDNLEKTELAEFVRPIRGTYEKSLRLISEINNKIERAKKAQKKSKEQTYQYDLARFKLFLRKAAEKGLVFCDGSIKHHLAKEVRVCYVFSHRGLVGSFIQNVCPDCIAEMKRIGEYGYELYDLRRVGGKYEILKNNDWVPVPENTYDHTRGDLIGYVRPEYVEKYNLPPDIDFEVRPPDTLNERWFVKVEVRD